MVTSSLVYTRKQELMGFTGNERLEKKLNFNTLTAIFANTPGLVADELGIFVIPSKARDLLRRRMAST